MRLPPCEMVLLYHNDNKVQTGTITISSMAPYNMLVFHMLSNVEHFYNIVMLPWPGNVSFFHACGNGSNTNDFPHYRSNLYVEKVSDTQLKLGANYNNGNWIIGLKDIWGIVL